MFESLRNALSVDQVKLPGFFMADRLFPRIYRLQSIPGKLSLGVVANRAMTLNGSAWIVMLRFF